MVGQKESNRAAFRYATAQDVAVSWRSGTACVEAISAAFRASPVAGTLNLGLPAGLEMPLCGNPVFRSWAASILKTAPGLAFFVCGGTSAIARELLLAVLPNLQAVMDATGQVSVTYPAFEAQCFFHEQFEAMVAAGVKEDDAIRELTHLSRQLGMPESLWA
ncbi:MAG: hypothetical protein ACOYMS_03470 [Terrimicrobiaceae bacterium]